MSNRNNIYFILNPAAGKGRGAKVIPQMERLLNQFDIPKENLKISEYPGHATEIVNTISNSALKIFSIGGDGSLNEIINGINNNHHMELGVIPIGSGNDFARAIGNLKKDFLVEKYLLSDKMTMCDIGHLTVICKNQVILDRKFISSLGIGFDALVAYKIRSIKYLKGLLLYLASVFASLMTYKAPISRLEIPQNELNIKDRFFFFAVGNTETAGGGFILNPGARIDDGYLNLCLAKDITKMTLLRVLPRAITGTHIKDKNVFTYRFNDLTYSTAEKVFLHVDGEAIELAEGKKTIRIQLAKKKQKVVVF
ncbi:MAG: YegS/Rv2252/BmrU family lipid kinase [Ignavibacteriaceae bacterium]|jgi:YegS/Rv2252/BmrU family lipid kinase